jgi:predicted small secreted protein
MKKLAIVTVAVLALGVAGCNKAENNAANETAVENNAETDVNAATNDATAADQALNAAGNDVNAAGNAVDNAQNAVSNATTNK